jgi:hypothetical protein
MRLRLDKFAFRQWDDASYPGTRMPPGVSKTAFLEHVVALGPQPLVDGYAPFCKHVFVKNFVPGLKGTTVALTAENKSLVESAYQARTEKELPVLVRWIGAERAAARPDATWLDLILYSKEQIVSECKAMGEADDTSGEDYEWGIISVKAQDEPRELPMTPITMLRNALGREEGGSGVPLDRARYLDSVAYWSAHVTVA